VYDSGSGDECPDEYSTPTTKARNMGYILTGLLTGILASRVLGGIVGEHFGWRMITEPNFITPS